MNLQHVQPSAPLLRRSHASAATVLRRCACGGHPGPSGECEECRAKRTGLRRSASSPAAPGFAPPLVHEVLRSRGRPLDPETRSFMEPRFGHSFADVRVHADGRAAESAAAVQAHAYTVGRDVVFGAGRYVPESAEGRRLIAHELAHVVQQSAGGGTGLQPRLEIGAVDAPEERQADAAATRVMGTAMGAGPLVRAGSGPALRRQGGTTTAPATAPAAVDDARVQRYIDDALATHHSVTAAFHTLKDRRQLQENCENMNLAAAEHYMFARSMVGESEMPYAGMVAAILAYSVSKMIGVRVRAGACPVTPPSAAQVRWALSGATDGMFDYYTPRGP